jgi:hypothetical protein
MMIRRPILAPTIELITDNTRPLHITIDKAATINDIIQAGIPVDLPVFFVSIPYRF